MRCAQVPAGPSPGHSTVLPVLTACRQMHLESGLTPLQLPLDMRQAKSFFQVPAHYDKPCLAGPCSLERLLA